MEFVKNKIENEPVEFGDVVEIEDKFYLVAEHHCGYPILNNLNGRTNLSGAKDFEFIDRDIKHYNGKVYKSNKYKLKIVQTDQ